MEKGLGICCLISTPHCVLTLPRNQGTPGANSYKLPPGFTLRLWNAILDSLDLARAETGNGSLVLGATEGRSNGTLQVSERGARRGTALAGRTVVSRHLEDVNC